MVICLADKIIDRSSKAWVCTLEWIMYVCLYVIHAPRGVRAGYNCADALI